MKRVAVIGASTDRARFGNKAVRAFSSRGYQVFPVHPEYTEVEGIPCYASIDLLPDRPEIVSVYLSPPRLIKVLPDIAKKGCDELWLNPGTDTNDVISEANRLGIKTYQTCSILAVGMSPLEL
jgi:predicted CoA-binding protein